MSEGLLGSTNRSQGSHPGTEKASLEIGLLESRDLAKESELAVVQGFKNVGHVEFVSHVFIPYATMLDMVHVDVQEAAHRGVVKTTQFSLEGNRERP